MKIKKMNELINNQPEWLVDGLIRYTHRPALIIGQPGSGKGIIGSQLAENVAYGTPFLECQTKQMQSLYLSYEDDENDVAERTSKRHSKVNPDNTQTAPYFCYVGESDYEIFTLSNNKLVKGKDYSDFISTITNNNIKLVIIDHLSRIFRGDENNRDCVNQFCKLLTQLCSDAACMIVVLAHTNKIGDYSGCSANAGSYRQIYHIKGNEEKTFTCIKNNLAAIPESIHYLQDEDLYCSVVHPYPHIDYETGKLYTRDDICALIGAELNTKTFAAYAAANNLAKLPQRKKIKGVLKTVYALKGENNNE